MIVSVDLGYKYVKAVNSQRSRVLIPSFVSKAVSRQLEGLFGAATAVAGIDINKLHLVITDQGQREEYFAGEMAARTKHPVTPFGDNKITHYATKVLLSAAMGLLTSGKEEAVHITAGLPLMYYAAQKDELRRYLSNLYLSVEYPQADGLKHYRRIAFSDVTIFPQGAGAVYYVSVMQKDAIGGKHAEIGLVDVGSKTTEALMFNMDGGIVIDIERSGTFELGTSIVEEHVRTYFQDTYSRRLENYELHHAIQKKQIYYRGNIVNLQPVIEEARHLIAASIKEELNRLWGRSQDMLYCTLWAGGGSTDIAPYIEGHNAVLVKDAQYANALGNLLVVELAGNTERRIRAI